MAVNLMTRTFDISEAIPSQPGNASRKANDRVRSVVRKVQQSATLGGYWLFSGGRPVFIRTVGKNVRSGKKKKGRDLDKLPKGPKANRTINTSRNKKKDSITKPASKSPTKVANIEKAKPPSKRK
jgi:hypothetical protein